MSTPRVVVTGDLLLDHNVRRRIPQLAQTYSDPFDEAVGSRSLGGAWYLSRLIDAMLERRTQRESRLVPTAGDPTPVVSLSEKLFDELEKFGHVIGPQRISPKQRLDGVFAKAFTLWQQYSLDRKNENQKKKETWRAESFLGCQKSRLIDAYERKLTNSFPLADWASLVKAYRQINKLNLKVGLPPDILVIDDQNLGFGHCPRLWPEVLQDKDTEASSFQHIILKIAGPLRQHQLWERLQDFRDRLTVIVTADDLRARGAELKVGFSWDAAIEELNHEFQEGASAYDLAQCARVIVLYRGGSAAACYSRGDLGVGIPRSSRNSGLTLQRFLYRPEEPEGAFLLGREGSMFGAASLLTAGIVLHERYRRHATDPVPLFHAIGRSLAAIRTNHEAGGKESSGKPPVDGLHPDFDQLCDILVDGFPRENAKHTEAAGSYFTAYPQGVHSPLSQYAPTRKEVNKWDTPGPGSTPERSDLLGDLTGPSAEFVYAVGVQIVRDGWEKALAGVPHAKYEKYVTFDRDEVQRINAVRSLIDAYLNNANDKRPLSIAVFGKPGTGKSFSIKELAKSFHHHNFKTKTFNLSEFPDDPEAGLASFHDALHQVRDETIGGGTPLVFWDEFDAGHFRWLKQFLAPMQDHEFRVRSTIHQLGRAVFVFAGGTSTTYQEFYDKAGKLTEEKGPDFISRLRGFMNIKGPNVDRTAADSDEAHIIRRAVLLRGRLELDYAHLIDGSTKRAEISSDIIRGFLRVDEYRHGARSMESVLSMSQLAGRASFQRSQLPTQPQLDMHVSRDFLEKINNVITPPDIVETVAEAYYKKYSSGGNYHDQPEEEKDKNRRVAYAAFAKIDDVDWMVDRVSSQKTPATADPRYSEKIGILAEFEHDRWLREYLIQGYSLEDQGRTVTPDFKKFYRLNINLAPTAQLTPISQRNDAHAFTTLIEVLKAHGFQVVMKSG